MLKGTDNVTELTIKDLQDYLFEKYRKGGTTTGFFMKLVEEVGEVAEAINHIDGRKLMDGNTSLEHELVDVFHYTIAIAAINNIDLSKAILEKDEIASIKYKQTPNLKEFIQTSKELTI